MPLIVFNALYVIYYREYVLKHNFVSHYFNIHNFNDKERQEFLYTKKSLEKLKGWLKREEISEPKLVPKLKMEISI